MLDSLLLQCHPEFAEGSLFQNLIFDSLCSLNECMEQRKALDTRAFGFSRNLLQFWF